MLRIISKIILWLFGWKVQGSFSPGLKKCVLVVAPHTSKWDFIVGRFAFWGLNIKVKFLIKKEQFHFPFKYLFKAMGGIPVDRDNSKSLVGQVANLYENNESMIIIITPEGTRSLKPKWKKGFYYIARQANVPIVLGFLDYKRKVGGIGPIMETTGDFEKDFLFIEDFYKDVSARFPENFNLSSQNRK